MIINVNSNLFMHTAFFKVLLRFLHEIGYTKVGKFLSSKSKKHPAQRKGTVPIRLMLHQNFHNYSGKLLFFD